MAVTSEDARTIVNHAHEVGNAVHLHIWYPRSTNIQYLMIGLMDVRAADDIRISYDFTRDGYVIEQASTFSWDADDMECDPDWQEVAFIKAWQRDVTDSHR